MLFRSELEAALGLAQLENWQDMIAKRKRNANYLTKNLHPYGAQGLIQLPYIDTHNSSAWMMYPLVMLGEDKWGMCNYLEESGIETREMLPLTNQPCYNGLFNEADYPVAQWINESGFYIASHQSLSLDDLDYMIDTISNYFME